MGDIIYIPTWQGWLYRATVIDCATRKIVGWAMDDHYRTPLITAAVEMAATVYPTRKKARDDVARYSPGQPHRVLIGFGAAVGEQDPVEISGRALRAVLRLDGRGVGLDHRRIQRLSRHS